MISFDCVQKIDEKCGKSVANQSEDVEMYQEVELSGNVTEFTIHTVNPDDTVLPNVPPEAVTNPVGFLNEYCQKRRLTLKYQESDLCTKHRHWFQTVAIVGDEHFPSGEGCQKKDARKQATIQAIQSLLASDSHNSGWSVQNSSTADGYEQEDQLNLDSKTIDFLESIDKHPISFIMEFAQRNKFHQPIFVDGTLPGRRFSCHLIIENETFPQGRGTNKKDARINATVNAINVILLSGLDSDMLSSCLVLNRQCIIDRCTITAVDSQVVQMPQLPNNACMHDKIAFNVHCKFTEFARQSLDVADSGKVIAGIVMVDEGKDAAYVISWATGNRCVSGSHLSQEGTVVNDCHAEILCRRGLLRFFYKQMLLWKLTDDLTIFESRLQNGILMLKSCFRFHLYINTAPCGDGRVFCLNETNDANANSVDIAGHMPIMNDPKKQGLLRTKIESGEGTIPVLDCTEFQTLDGITGGERLRTMSCSDKILKWNVLGLQGNLLASKMYPIYLSSITIGTLHHHGHQSRAFCCRSRGIASILKPPYRINHPTLTKGGVKPNSTRDISKSTSISANWNIADDSVEVIDSQVGVALRPNRQPSRLCKRAFFDQFWNICRLTNSMNLLPSEYYMDAKLSNIEYQLTKMAFYRFLSKGGMGNWLTKPREEKLFRI